MRLIQKSFEKQESITIYKPQSWFQQFLGLTPEIDSIQSYPGKVTYSDCIIESDVELSICVGFTHIFDNIKYHNIIPLKKVTGSDSQYIWAVDYVSKNV